MRFFFCPQTGSWIPLDLLYVVMVISDRLKPCPCDTFQSDKPPLLCQFLIRWSGFCLLFHLTVENFQYKFGFHSRHWRTVEKQGIVSKKVTLVDRQCSDDFVLLFSSVTCCINIVVQTSSRAICLESGVPHWSWHAKILSYVDAFAIDQPTALLGPTPTVGEGIEFQIYRSSQTHSTTLNVTKIEFVDCSESIPKIIRSRKSGISHLWCSSFRDLGAAQVLGRSAPLAHGLWLRCLKRTFIRFIAKLWVLWVCKCAAHSSRFFQK